MLSRYHEKAPFPLFDPQKSESQDSSPMPLFSQLTERLAAPRRIRFLIAGLPGLGMLLSLVALFSYASFREPASDVRVVEPAVVSTSSLATQPPLPSRTSHSAALAAVRQPMAVMTGKVTSTPTATPIAPPTATAPTATPLAVPVCGRAVVVGVRALNLRQEPAITAPVLAVVPRSEAVEWLCTDPVQADRQVWRHVRYQRVTGWMSDRFLALQPDQITPIPATAVPGAFVYVFPVRGTQVSYGPYHHDYPATDIFAPPGSLFVAPTSGRIEFVNRVDRWNAATDVPADRGGIMLSLIGDDGVRYYGSHLQAIAESIEVGVRVEAGQLLGYTGASGNAARTPPHLHFGISRPTTPDDWRTRRGELSPYPYLKAWERGEMLTPDLSLIRP